MDIGYWIGWVGVAFGICVPLPQIYKMLRTKSTQDVSKGTYVFLCCALICYLIHAIHIGATVFIVAHSFNLTTNSIILAYLLRRR